MESWDEIFRIKRDPTIFKHMPFRARLSPICYRNHDQTV